MNDNPFGYMYILDYESCNIYECELDEKDENLDASDILKRRGFKESQVNYMTSECKLKLCNIPSPTD